MPQLAVVPAQAPDQAMFVRLIDPPTMPVTVQPPEPPAPPSRLVRPPPAKAPPPRLVTHERPRRDAMVVQDHGQQPAQATSAAAPSGLSVLTRLPEAETTYATSNPKIKSPKPAEDSQIMQHDLNQMHTKTTRFEKYFPPPNESAGGAVGRHVGDAMKEIAKSICDPKKGFNPLCGSPPIPPSPKDGDVRLSLPSAPLSHDPDPPKGPSLGSCIAEYKATRPLSYGCPINTPDLAFNADVRICNDLFRAGKRLQPWCPVDTARRAAAESAAPAASPSAGSP